MFPVVECSNLSALTPVVYPDSDLVTSQDCQEGDEEEGDGEGGGAEERLRIARTEAGRAGRDGSVEEVLRVVEATESEERDGGGVVDGARVARGRAGAGGRVQAVFEEQGESGAEAYGEKDDRGEDGAEIGGEDGSGE